MLIRQLSESQFKFEMKILVSLRLKIASVSNKRTIYRAAYCRIPGGFNSFQNYSFENGQLRSQVVACLINIAITRDMLLQRVIYEKIDIPDEKSPYRCGRLASRRTRAPPRTRTHAYTRKGCTIPLLNLVARQSIDDPPIIASRVNWQTRSKRTKEQDGLRVLNPKSDRVRVLREASSPSHNSGGEESR